MNRNLTVLLFRQILAAGFVVVMFGVASAQSTDGLCDVNKMQTASAEEVKEMLRPAPGAYVRCYEGYTPLHVAISARNPAAVVAIAQSGADLNARNEFGSTAMHVAVMASRPDLVELLIKLGANKEAFGPDNETPLAMAKSWGETTIVDLLVSSGARF